MSQVFWTTALLGTGLVVCSASGCGELDQDSHDRTFERVDFLDCHSLKESDFEVWVFWESEVALTWVYMEYKGEIADLGLSDLTHDLEQVAFLDQEGESKTGDQILNFDDLGPEALALTSFSGRLTPGNLETNVVVRCGSRTQSFTVLQTDWLSNQTIALQD